MEARWQRWDLFRVKPGDERLAGIGAVEADLPGGPDSQQQIPGFKRALDIYQGVELLAAKPPESLAVRPDPAPAETDFAYFVDPLSGAKKWSVTEAGNPGYPGLGKAIPESRYKGAGMNDISEGASFEDKYSFHRSGAAVLSDSPDEAAAVVVFGIADNFHLASKGSDQGSLGNGVGRVVGSLAVEVRPDGPDDLLDCRLVENDDEVNRTECAEDFSRS